MSIDLLPITPADKLSELKRELEMRRHVYGKGGTISGKNQRRIEVLEAIIKDYEAMQ